MDYEKFLGDDKGSDELGVLNGFRSLLEKYIKVLVDEGKWFAVCHKIDDNQVDLMKLKSDDGTTIGQLINEVFEENVYRTSIYRYMLMNFLCYVEVPTLTYKTESGVKKQTFNKMLVTANTDVIASWLGITPYELPDKYISRVWGIDMNDDEDELPYVQLNESKRDGVRKVTCPRKNLDVSVRGTRVVPLFMLKSGVDALYNKMREGIIKVSFMKDSGQIRDMFTTLSFPKIREIYGGGSFYDDSVLLSYDGEFLENKTLVRGYIRVPEIGGSKYDVPVRTINYARITDIDYETEPDLSFVNIDLSTVVDAFEDGVSNNMNNSSAIISMLEEFGLDSGSWSGDNPIYPVKNAQSLIEWVSMKKILIGTIFERDLCMFMLSNPQWFPSFDGKPKYSSGYSVNSGDVGLA